MHNQISEKNKTSRLVRTISGVVFICLLLPAVALGGWLYFLLISFFTIVACHERLEAPGKNKFPLYRKGIVYVFRLLFAYGGLIQSWAKGNNPFKDPWFGFSMDSLYVSLIGLIVYLLILFSIAIFSIVSPRYCVWSRLIDVIAVTSALSITFVASRSPPIPTSKTT